MSRAAARAKRAVSFEKLRRATASMSCIGILHHRMWQLTAREELPLVPWVKDNVIYVWWRSVELLERDVP